MSRKLRIVYYVERDTAALAWRAAQYFVEMAEEAVDAEGRARIAISGGSTPKAAFELLGDPGHPWRGRMPWDRLDLYWVDERCVPPDDPESNYRMTREALLDSVPLRPEQVHRMEGELEPEEAAARYEAELRNDFKLEGTRLPRFDLVALGMGPDGHTASLFPRTEALHEKNRLVVANHVLQKDAWRVTLTWPVINHAKSVFFLAGGADKAAILKEVLTGERDVERLPSQLIWPASGILTLILDKSAASLLPATDNEGCGFLEREG
jgi:6-phosphogluconolactonase